MSVIRHLFLFYGVDLVFAHLCQHRNSLQRMPLATVLRVKMEECFHPCCSVEGCRAVIGQHELCTQLVEMGADCGL